MCRELYELGVLGAELLCSEMSRRIRDDFESCRGRWLTVVPDIHNYFSCKIALHEYMKSHSKKAKSAQTLRMDALIAFTAINTHAFVWTDNIKDFALASWVVLQGRTDDRRMSSKIRPAFDTETLKLLLQGRHVCVYERMAERVKDNRDKEALLKASGGCS